MPPDLVRALADHPPAAARVAETARLAAVNERANQWRGAKNKKPA